jgi:hypothetical protein
VEIAKSAGFNSPQLAALRLNLFFIDTPWLDAGNFIMTSPDSTIPQKLTPLRKSKFRSKFKISKKTEIISPAKVSKPSENMHFNF